MFSCQILGIVVHKLDTSRAFILVVFCVDFPEIEAVLFRASSGAASCSVFEHKH